MREVLILDPGSCGWEWCIKSIHVTVKSPICTEILKPHHQAKARWEGLAVIIISDKKRVAVDRTSQHTVDLSNPLLNDGDSIPNSFLLRLHTVIKESPKSNLKGCMLRRFKDRDGEAEETYLS